MTSCGASSPSCSSRFRPAPDGSLPHQANVVGRPSDTDTIEAFEAFLNDFPDSEHATRARGRIAELRTLQPAPDAVATTEEVPLAPTTDPDLLPAGAVTPPSDTTGGPQQITPPSEEATPPADGRAQITP